MLFVFENPYVLSKVLEFSSKVFLFEIFTPNINDVKKSFERKEVKLRWD